MDSRSVLLDMQFENQRFLTEFSLLKFPESSCCNPCNCCCGNRFGFQDRLGSDDRIRLQKFNLRCCCK